MSKLQLLLLGHFDCLLSSGERISLSMRKAEVLLAYLALAPGIRHPRERLINLLWSDRGEEQARNSLRQCLSAIRKALGDSAELLLSVDRTTVMLKPELVDVDALEFERLAAGADFESLSDAAALYRGEFLEGISIRDAASQEWLDSERARFKRQFIEILFNLAETQFVSHEYGNAIRSAERLVEQDPLAEPGWRLLMRAYHENGDRSHALQACKRCQKVLRNELGVDPEPATLELRESIAAGESASSDASPAPASPAAITGVIPEQQPARAGANTQDQGIAVLPFDNLSGDPEQEYFSDGITDSIIMNLALFPGLSVKSRNSSFAFKQQIKSLGEISRELGVDYVVEGSVRRAAGRVRVNVQLIESASGNQIWGKRYDSDLDDLFELEEDLSRSIAATVTGQIESELQRIAIAKGAADQNAYDLLLQGIFYANRNEAADLPLAIDKLNECLALEADNAQAHATLAYCYEMGWIDRWMEDFTEARRLCGEHARKAHELDPKLGMAQVAYAEYLLFTRRYEEAETLLTKALQINPNDAEAIGTLAIRLSCAGRPEEALGQAELALRLDPYHRWARWIMTEALFFCGRYQDALATIEAIGNPPGFIQVYRIASCIELGRMDDARDSLKAFIDFCRDNMASPPRTLDQWLAYSRDNAPFADPSINQRLVDYLVTAGLDEIPESAGAESSVAARDTSIAVLPFDNLSGDPEQEYFSDGITESIILNLALFPGLHVKSRNSSFAFKQQLKGLAEISRELEVDYVVEGSVRRSKDRIRITAQLIDAANGNQVWGKRYDAEIDDLFDLEENLSREIAATVTGRIESELQRIAVAKGAADQQAYDLLLAGMYHASRFNAADNAVAIEKFERCLAQDPDNVRAHVGLYICYSMGYLGRWIADYKKSYDRAWEYIRRALQLDPDDRVAQVYYGEMLLFSGELDKARQQIDKVLAQNPNDTDALAVLANIQNAQGDSHSALITVERALKLDPYHPWAEWELAVARHFCGDYEGALEAIRTMRAVPGFITLYAVASLVKLERTNEARETLREFIRDCEAGMQEIPRDLDEWLQYTRENYTFADAQINRDLLDTLVKAGLEEFIPAGAVPSDRTSAGTTTETRNIAVLPFDNLSGDPEQEYFSDGISESVIMNLSLFPGLSVKSRNSSFAFKQQLKGLSEISRELEVDYIVEGSVRKSKERIRITAQLIDAANGNQVWGKRYDSDLADLFELEENLSREIAATVTGRIESELQRIAVAKGAADQHAYDLLLAGMYHAYRFNATDNAVAIEKFERCLALDPDNVRAHVGLSASYNMAYLERWIEDYQQSFDKSWEYIRRALQLDPEDRTVQVFHAETLLFSGELNKAQQQIDRALAQNPSDTDALAVLANVQIAQGDFQQALKTAERTLKLDPYHPWAKWELAVACYLCGNYEGALETITTMRATPGFITLFAVAALVSLERIEEARETLREFVRGSEAGMKNMPRDLDEWLQYTRENYPFADAQINRDLLDTLLQASLEEMLPPSGAPADDASLPSILVLPFANLSGDPEQEYFSDGISESLIVNLNLFTGLNVKSRHASFAFKDSNRDLDEIAGELGVQYIVEGSIRKFGDKVRITAQLSDTASGNQVWGKRFDYALADLFTLEEELVQTIAGTVSGRIGRKAMDISIQKPARDLRSYDYLMRGSYHLERFNAEDSRIAREQLGKCLQIDPGNAEAHAQLGVALSIDLFEGWSDDPQRDREASLQHLQTALQLQPENAYTHAYLAEHQLFTRDFKLGLYHAERSIELNPTLADGYNVKAYLLAVTGEIDDAVKHADTSMQIDPYSYYVGWNAGEVYRMAGLYQRSLDTFRSIPHMSPSVHAQVAACLAGLGRIDEAREEMSGYHRRAREQMAEYPASEAAWRQYWYQTVPYERDADFEVFYQQLLQAGLLDRLAQHDRKDPSIAVLPFENMSGDHDQLYFSDGITASIILSLGLFRGLTVKSQQTSFAFRESRKSSEEIARELDVDYLVEGSIRKSSDRVRLSVQLIESASGNQVWGKQYNAALEDVLGLEQEMSSAIAGTISGRIGHTLQQTAVRNPAKNLQSFDYLMRGLYHFGKMTAGDLAIARKEIEKCLEIDPENATAHSNLGEIHHVEVLEHWSKNPARSIELASLHLETAVEADPDHATAHAYLAEFLFNHREYGRSEFHADRAIELNPTAPEGYMVKADVLGFSRRLEQAIQCADQCLRLDPHSVGSGWAAGGVYMNAGQYEKAIKIFRSISHPPASIHALVAACFIGLGLTEEARNDMRRYREMAARQMPVYPQSKDAWRSYWRGYQSFRFEEDFDELFGRLLEAGLCDDPAASADDVPSIAVLPFENMSGDSEQEHFADGITADVVDTLSRFKHLRTISRYSTQQYKTHRPAVTEIARQQQVRYVLEGSVRRSGDRIRVNAELIDCGDGQILWSERYDRNLHDLFAVQDELTQSIALAMKVQLDDGDMARSRSRGSSSIKAWELTLAAVDLQDTYVRKNILEARALAEEAIRLDPDYAYAWVSLGWTHWQEIYSGWDVSIEKSIAAAENALAQARAIDPEYAEAYSFSGLIQLMKHDPDAAIRDCLKAVELEPGNAEIQALAAFSHVFAGDYKNGRYYEQQVRRLCPVRANWYYLIDAQIEVATGNFARAAEIYRDGLAVEPESPLCRFFLVDLMMQMGDEKAACSYADEIRALDRNVSGRGIVLTYSADPALRDAFRARLSKFDLV